MKFSLMLILPCFLALGTVSFASFTAIDGSAAPTSERQSTLADASDAATEEAHRGSGRLGRLA